MIFTPGRCTDPADATIESEIDHRRGDSAAPTAGLFLSLDQGHDRCPAMPPLDYDQAGGFQCRLRPALYLAVCRDLRRV